MQSEYLAFYFDVRNVPTHAHTHNIMHILKITFKNLFEIVLKVFISLCFFVSNEIEGIYNLIDFTDLLVRNHRDRAISVSAKFTYGFKTCVQIYDHKKAS